MIISASLASLLGVVLVILGGKQKGANQDLSVAVAVVSVLLSWLSSCTATSPPATHRLYYTGTDGGIDFKERRASRSTHDFA